MTPEERQYLEMLASQRQIETNPMARAVNDYGQGSGYLGLDKQPESWDRLGEANDIYQDVFGMTGLKMADLVPGLYPEVEDPGQYQGFVSNLGSLYGSNPAFQEMEAALQEPGATVYEVLDLVAKNPRLQQFLPKDDSGMVDREAFNRDATMYLSERARENTERGAYDTQVAEYEDFNRPRTGLDFAPVRGDKILLDAPPAPDSLASRVGDAGYDMGQALKLETARRQRDQAREDAANQARSGSMTSPDVPAGVNRSGNRLGMRVQNLREDVIPEQTAQRGRRQKEQEEMVKLYNKMGSQAYDRTVANKERKVAPSKNQENMAKLIQFRNMLMYGEV